MPRPTSRPHQRSRALMLVTVGALLAAACSSSTTADGGPASRTPIDVATGTGVPTAEASIEPRSTGNPDVRGSAPTTPGQAGTSPATSGPGGGAGTSGPDTVGGTPGSAAGGTSGPAGPTPASGEPLKIGYVFYTGNATAVIGMDSPAPSAERHDRWIRALEDHVNETGGFGGRPIEVHIRHIDSTDTSASTQARLQTETCIDLTEDVGVFMAIGFEGFNRATGCWIEHETPAFSLSGMDSENDLLAMRPWILPNLWLSTPRMAQLIPHALCERGGWVNDSIGVFAFNDPATIRAVEEHMVPAFERCGGTVKDIAYVSPSLDSISAETSNAVLRFSTQDIDRVAILAGGGGGMVLFASAAESQNYRPLIAISSFDRPGVFAQAIPEQQRRNLSGVGFHVAIDVSASAMPPMRPREHQCFEIINERTNESFSDRGNPAVDASAVFALGTCDSLWAVQHALRPATGTALAPRDVIDHLFAAGGSYAPVFFDEVTWAQPRRDAIDAYADLVWGTDCACMRYDSEFRPIPF